METYSLQKPIASFLYFWLNYCDENIERTPIAVENIDHFFNLANEIIKADRLHLFLLSDSTRIDNNEYLSSLENGTELIVCTEEQMQKLSVCYELKRYLIFKNISYHLAAFWMAASHPSLCKTPLGETGCLGNPYLLVA